jgi:hypothetical protein
MNHPHGSTGSAPNAPRASRTGMTPARALLMIPGTLMWVLIIAGTSTGRPTLIGIGVALFLISAVVMLSHKAKASAAQRAERRRLWTTGKVGEARVVSIEARGGGYNGHPGVDFTLEVTLPGKEPYRTSIRAVVSKLAVPRIQPGCVLGIRVDPDNRDNLVIDETLTPSGYA